ncbi:hypothetical protein BYT27DRAFT_7190434 [Phlegmacium glaucopus]|nr:hypothetical protein BYT27DRAFT_7190434 [Phlegmacium glaucopus]
MTIDQHHRFINTINHTPRLGSLVQRYEYCMFDCARKVIAETLSAFYTLRVNLREFRFTGDKKMPLTYAILPSMDNIRTQLTTLYWRCSDVDEDHVAQFFIKRLN